MATRIEKYRAYREEIARMDENKPATRKSLAAELARNKLLEEEKERKNSAFNTTISLSYDDLMEAYQIYDKEHGRKMTPLDMVKRRHRIFVWVMIVLGILVAASLVATGIVLFRGGA